MPGEPIGEIPVIITGDLSALDTAIQSAVSASEEGATKIAEAFNVADLAAPMVAAAQEGATALGDLGEAATTAGGQLGEAATGAEDLGSAAAGAGSAAGEASAGIAEMGDAAGEAGSKVEGLGENLAQIAELVGVGLGIAEAVESFKELATESIEAAGKLQMVEVALTTFTGSAETAKSILDDLKSLAAQSIFSFPELAGAAQKMAALGIAATSIPPALYAAAASAEATGNSLGAVSNALDRVYLTGTLSTRQLATLGISMQDLATVMGIGADQVKEKFKELGSGSDESLTILTTAITNKVGPAFQSMQDTVPVAINRVKVAWDSMLEDFGKAVAPDVSAVLGAIESLIEPTGRVVTLFTELSLGNFGPIITSARDLGAVMADIGKEAGITGGELSGIDWKTFASDVVNFATHLRDFKDALGAVDDGVRILTNHFPDMDAAVAKSVQNVVSATEALTQAQVASQLAVEAHMLALKNLASGAGDAEAATAKLVATVTKEETTLANARAALADIEANYKSSSDYAQLHEKAVQAVDAAYKALNPTLNTHVSAMQKVAEKYGDFLPQADAVTKAVAKILEQTQASETAYTTASAAYAKLLELQKTGLATQDSVDAAFKKMVTDGEALGWSYQHIADQAVNAKAAQLDLNTVIVNGHPVIVGLGSDATDAADGIVKLKGSTDDAQSSMGGLNARIIDVHGNVTSLAQDIPNLTKALSTLSDQAQADTQSFNDLDAALQAVIQSEWDAARGADAFNAASASGKGGKGGGTSGSEISATASGIVGSGVAGLTSGIVGSGLGNVGLITLGGSNLDTQNLFGLASGGIATQGNAYVVGEAGPELFIPDQTGTVLPAGTFEMADAASVRTPASTGLGTAGMGDMSRVLASINDGITGTASSASSAVGPINDVSGAMATIPAAAASVVSAVSTVAQAMAGGMALLGSPATAASVSFPSSGPSVGRFSSIALTPAGLPPSGPALNPGTGGFGLGQGSNYGTPNITINMAGAVVYGQQGADMMMNAATNVLRTGAGQLKF